ncbi:hypothetical protein FAGKG844_160072 [Frankia sp. AgKG'84/4]
MAATSRIPTPVHRPVVLGGHRRRRALAPRRRFGMPAVSRTPALPHACGFADRRARTDYSRCGTTADCDRATGHRVPRYGRRTRVPRGHPLTGGLPPPLFPTTVARY